MLLSGAASQAKSSTNLEKMKLLHEALGTQNNSFLVVKHYMLQFWGDPSTKNQINQTFAKKNESVQIKSNYHSFLDISTIIMIGWCHHWHDLLRTFNWCSDVVFHHVLGTSSILIMFPNPIETIYNPLEKPMKILSCRIITSLSCIKILLWPYAKTMKTTYLFISLPFSETHKPIPADPSCSPCLARACLGWQAPNTLLKVEQMERGKTGKTHLVVGVYIYTYILCFSRNIKEYMYCVSNCSLAWFE